MRFGKRLPAWDQTGNRIVSFENVQFTKAPNVLPRLTHLSKNETTIQELTEKAMAPE